MATKGLSQIFYAAICAKLGPCDRWRYSVLQLRDDERSRPDIDALQFTRTAVEGQARFGAIFEEENGSSYVADVFAQRESGGKSIEAVAVLTGSTLVGGWSKPDPNGKLDADKIMAVRIVCNTNAERVKFCFQNLRWTKLGVTGNDLEETNERGSEQRAGEHAANAVSLSRDVIPLSIADH